MENVYFYKTRSPFSNFYPVPDGFTYMNVHLPTSEHHLMFQKALLMGDAVSALKIREAKTPAAAKRLGRKVSPWDLNLWKAHSQDIMTNILIAKFQHPDMRDFLVNTGNADLYEAAPNDKIWGIGISVKDAKAGKQHNGLNQLGRCLMAARAALTDVELA